MTGKIFHIPTKEGPRRFSLPNRALYDFETVHGEQPLAILFRGEYGPKAVSHFLYAGMKAHDPDMTLDQAVELVDYTNLEATVAVIVEAIQDAYDIGSDPEDEKQVKKKGKKKP